GRRAGRHQHRIVAGTDPAEQHVRGDVELVVLQSHDGAKNAATFLRRFTFDRPLNDAPIAGRWRGCTTFRLRIHYAWWRHELRGITRLGVIEYRAARDALADDPTSRTGSGSFGALRQLDILNAG